MIQQSEKPLAAQGGSADPTEVVYSSAHFLQRLQESEHLPSQHSRACDLRHARPLFLGKLGKRTWRDLRCYRWRLEVGASLNPATPTGVGKR